MLTDFCQFLYDSMEKVLFKADFFFHDRNAQANTSTQCEYSEYADVHNAIVQCIAT